MLNVLYDGMAYLVDTLEFFSLSVREVLLCMDTKFPPSILFTPVKAPTSERLLICAVKERQWREREKEIRIPSL